MRFAAIRRLKTSQPNYTVFSSDAVLFGRTVEWIQRGTLKSEATEGILRHTLNPLEPFQQPVTCRLPDRKDRQAPNQLFR